MRAALPVLIVIAFTLPTSAQQKIENTFNRDSCTSKPDMVALTAKANAGDPEAQYQMGRAALGLGRPTPDKMAKASAWFEKAAEQDHAQAQDEMGRLNYGDRSDRRQAAFWFGKAAEQGNDDAQLWLGTMYEEGRVVGQDKAEALKWYRLSAKQGNPDAQVSLGQMYENGDGVQQDYLEAEKWYRKAAEHFPDRGGAGVGRNQLANLYRDGRLVPNYVDAYMWFAIFGSVEDMKHAAKHMTRAQIVEAQRRAREWVKTHPDTGPVPDPCLPENAPLHHSCLHHRRPPADSGGRGVSLSREQGQVKHNNRRKRSSTLSRQLGEGATSQCALSFKVGETDTE